MGRPSRSAGGLVNRRIWSCLIVTACLGLSLQAKAQAQAKPQGQIKVDLELILMVDGSGSVDDEEYRLQRLGYAQALRNPRVLGAIRNGPLGRIALAYVEWSGADLKVPIVDWTLLSDADSVLGFAKQLEVKPRELYSGGTAVGDAIVYGAQSLWSNGFQGKRRVIDISGDGPDRDGLPAALGRDQAVAQGNTINGLPVLGEDFPGLDIFYLDNVIGGPGAFSIPARSFKDINSAVLTKLIREIAGISGPRHIQRAQMQPTPTVQLQ